MTTSACLFAFFFYLSLVLLQLRTVMCCWRGGYFGGCNEDRKGITERSSYTATRCRGHYASLAEFGGVGDGVTLNTNAFRRAVYHLSQFTLDGGGLLYVPPGRWLTGSFNLTSFFTLYLHREAVILGSQDVNDWPLTDPLPSYGRGRDAPGGRYSSLIRGYRLTDVIITGDNGTVNGQGKMWWDKYRNKQLNYTRGYLIEMMYCDTVLISNLTLIDSPSWNIHPVYSSNVIVKAVTILAPLRSPNTDGINPDSSTDVLIEDCYVVSGDDCVAIKSGWDEYGIRFGVSSKHIVIKRLTCISPTSAVIALGSEMSGGIRDVRAQDITAIDSESGVRIKTAVGRGGFVKDVFVRRMNLHTMKWVFWMTGAYNDHPDENWDKKAIPVVESINFADIAAVNVTMVGNLAGIKNAPFTGICMSNVTVGVKFKSDKPPWSCTDVQGVSTGVLPAPCPSLESMVPPQLCPFPDDCLPIEDYQLLECFYTVSVS
ncbi:Exo-polygalacturonase, family GH28 [Zostera marina]|uniref:Exo-polygalacturonase, family GH28 n=1 Tax=Zostera marina TaxID=29655 RepID=A0A0K9P8M8_ZOSMR|nr:Exo-polygalacturonase, family GH28 [Zostera marina]